MSKKFKRTVVAQQGEVKVFKISALPAEMTTKDVEKTQRGEFIISHSEQGHHHVIDSRFADVMERTDNVPSGMQILYALVKESTDLKQDAVVPHDKIALDGGSIYELRIAREYDAFREMARRVAD
jgi:hypothetical protein